MLVMKEQPAIAGYCCKQYHGGQHDCHFIFFRYIHVLIAIVIVVACLFISHARSVGAIMTVAVISVIIAIANVAVFTAMEFTIIIMTIVNVILCMRTGIPYIWPSSS